MARICPVCDKKCPSVNRFCQHYHQAHSKIKYSDGIRYGITVRCNCGQEFFKMRDFVLHVKRMKEPFDQHFNGERILNWLDDLGSMKDAEMS